MLSGAPDCAPLPDDFQVPPEASSSTFPTGALPFDPPTSLSRGPTSGAYIFYFNLAISGR